MIYLLFIPVLSLFLSVIEAAAQPGFSTGDVVTFADCRDVTAVDFTESEIIFATNNGLWRFDRMTAKSLDPEFFGRGLGSTFRFGGVHSLLYHRNTSTLWLSTDQGLFVRHRGIDYWIEIEGIGKGQVRLGERNDTLFFKDNSALYGIEVFGYRNLGNLQNVGTEGIRWSTDKLGGMDRSEMPFYHSVDPYLRYDPGQSKLVDWDFSSYRPTFSLIDPEFRRRYIGYPGLGVAIANDRIGSIDVFQPGPAGNGIRAIVRGDDGVLYLGGESHQGGDCLNRFDRNTGRWERLGRRQRWGLETGRIYDLAYDGRKFYAAAQEGLLIGNPQMENWGIYGLLEGAPKPPVWLVELVGRFLFIGGSGGIRKMLMPNGPYFDVKTGDGRDIYATDGVAEDDTLWLVSREGLLKGNINGAFDHISDDSRPTDLALRAIAVTPATVAVGGIDGVSLFDRRTHVWRIMPGNAHFEGAQVISLAAINGRFYIGTVNGLYQYDDRTGRLLPFRAEQGLPDPHVDKLMIEADTLWVGTRVGLTRINLSAPYWN